MIHNLEIRVGAKPPAGGEYLTLAYEWVGEYSAMPDEPSWTVRRWLPNRGCWQKANIANSGGWSNLIVIAWAELPPMDFTTLKGGSPKGGEPVAAAAS